MLEDEACFLGSSCCVGVDILQSPRVCPLTGQTLRHQALCPRLQLEVFHLNTAWELASLFDILTPMNHGNHGNPVGISHLDQVPLRKCPPERY